MREYAEILADAIDRRAFANGSEFDAWSSGWCDTCIFYADCDLLAVALIEGKTPVEWRPDQPGSLWNPYTCDEYVEGIRL